MHLRSAGISAADIAIVGMGRGSVFLIADSLSIALMNSDRKFLPHWWMVCASLLQRRDK